MRFLLPSRPTLARIVADELYSVERELLRAEANLHHYLAVVASLQARRQSLLDRQTKDRSHA